MDLLDDNLLSPLVLNMVQMADLLKAEQSELDRFSYEVEQQRNQLYLCTCDRELARYERMFALPINTSLNIPERRKKLIAKLNSRASATVKTIKDIVTIVTNEECEIVEHFSEYRFTAMLLFKDTTFYHSFTELTSQICEIKPAHLAFDINAVYAPQGFKNSNEFKLVSLFVSARVNNFGVEIINLDGRKSIDGTWKLTQVYTKGIEMKRFGVSVKAKNVQSTSASITADTMYYLDGAFCLDDKKRLDAAIIRSEL